MRSNVNWMKVWFVNVCEHISQSLGKANKQWSWETLKFLHNRLPYIPLTQLVQLPCVVSASALYIYGNDNFSYRMCVHKYVHNIWNSLIGRTKRHWAGRGYVEHI